MSTKDLTATAPTPWCEVPIWSGRYGDEQEQIPLAAAASAGGELAVVGIYNGSLDFGSGALATMYPAPTFAAHFTASGEVLWARRLAHSFVVTAPSAAVIDASGLLVVAGGFSGQVVIGERELLSSGSESAYLVKLDRGGQIVYVRVFDGAGGYSRIHSLGRDLDGGVIVAGTFDGNLRLDSSTVLSSVGHPDIFLARLDHQGRHLWSKRFGQQRCEVGDLAVGPLGDVVLSGRFVGNLDLGGELLGSFPPTSDYELFVARFGADGSHRFSRFFGSTDNDLSPRVAIDGAGRVALSAMFSGRLDFGGGVLEKKPSEVDTFGDLYLASLSSQGEHLWSQVIGGVYAEQIRELSFGADSTLNLVGDFSGSIRFSESTALIAAGQHDIFVAQLSANGEHLASAAYGEVATQQAVAGQGACGDVLVAACCRGELGFDDSDPLPGAENTCDVCLARVLP